MRRWPASLTMTPEELAVFASRVSVFSADQIDRLYQLVVGAQKGTTSTDPTALAEEWRSLGLREVSNSVADAVDDEVCLDFIIEVASIDPGTPLEAKFFK